MAGIQRGSQGCKAMKLFTSDKSFYSKTVKLAVPITLQCLITIGVNMMDNIMVGTLGENALSAVSLAVSYTHLTLPTKA